MKHYVPFVSHGTLDELVELWHGEFWPGLELEDVIRAATDWNHDEYDRWAVTGRTPDEPLVGLAERNWCGHEQEARS